MFEILLSSYFGLDHASSFEIIHTQIADSEFVWYYLDVWLQNFALVSNYLDVARC